MFDIREVILYFPVKPELSTDFDQLDPYVHVYEGKQFIVVLIVHGFKADKDFAFERTPESIVNKIKIKMNKVIILLLQFLLHPIAFCTSYGIHAQKYSESSVQFLPILYLEKIIFVFSIFLLYVQTLSLSFVKKNFIGQARVIQLSN